MRNRTKPTCIFEKAGSSTDSALAAVFVPLGYSEYQSMANSAMLGQIVQPWFYNQLRTEEQLGYAVFAFSDERWPSVGHGLPAAKQR